MPGSEEAEKLISSINDYQNQISQLTGVLKEIDSDLEKTVSEITSLQKKLEQLRISKPGWIAWLIESKAYKSYLSDHEQLSAAHKQISLEKETLLEQKKAVINKVAELNRSISEMKSILSAAT